MPQSRNDDFMTRYEVFFLIREKQKNIYEKHLATLTVCKMQYTNFTFFPFK
jgi:hypothetical protein